MKKLVQIPFEQAGAVENMACDIGMFRLGGIENRALWRMYGWSEAAITFGYSQKWADITSNLLGFSGICIRRLSGGGIVDHRNDLTYALCIPPVHHLYRTHASIVYKGLHGTIMQVLRDHGFDSDLSPCDRPCRDNRSQQISVCFQAPEPFDVVDRSSGRKQAGAAMKRDRSGLLIQGSLSRESLPGLERTAFMADFGQALAKWLDLSPASEPGSVPDQLLLPEKERFSSREWNQRR